MDRADAARTRLLLRFGRLAAGAGRPEEILPLLVDAAVDRAGVGAAAAAVLRVSEDGYVRLAIERGLPGTLAGWKTELEAVGPELGQQVLQAWGEQNRHVRTLPLVAGTDIYGALLVFSAAGTPFVDEQIELAAGLADLVAVSLDRATQYAALARSYTELRASREALAKAEKMRALGEMAAGISHDLKNILNPLALQLELLRRRIERKSETALEVVGHMHEAIRSGVDVVERLRAFSRQAPEQEVEAVELDFVLQTVVELCRPRLETSAVELRAEPGPSPTVLARKSELVTAVVNLVFNAIEAIEAMAASAATITVRTGAADGGGWIEVADTGPGIPPEVEARVFEPFFTTKEQGTGLGLAMVYAFVNRNGGQVTLHTVVGEGTRFRLWFPSPTP
jgi:signal transduction histidine kinase